MIRMLALLVLGLACVSAQATIYKWVDGNGVTQYTSVPPKDRQFEVVQHTSAGKLRHDPGRELSRLREAAASIDNQRAQSKEQQLQAAADAALGEKRSMRCEQARANLSTLEENTRLLLIDPDTGEEKRLNEEERLAQITQTHRDIAYFCDA